ncbi:RsmB/NOP family class I SAM-dependent RNA methyltransferase [Microbaculum marinum]
MAVDIVAGALKRAQTLDAALDSEHGHPDLARLDARDRAFVKVLAAETLRRHGQIDLAIKRFLEKPLPKSAAMVNTILSVGACQILFLDVPPHAAVDTAVSLAAADRAGRHFRGVVNAVLRRIDGARDDLRAMPDPGRLNTPGWLADRWTAAYGAEVAGAIMAAHLEEPPLDLTVRSEPEVWAQRLGGTALPTGTVRLTGAGDVTRLAGFEDGAWWVQDVAAALPAKLLGNVQGLRVVDLCAAPGGKTAQLAAAGATVTAVDRSAARMKRLEANLARLGLAARTVVADAAEWQPDEPFDAVLLDAPCAATGTLRRHPDIAWIRRASEIGRLADLQRRLLRRAVDIVKPGGTIVYATCSLEPEECEAGVDALIDAGAPVERVPVGAGEIFGLDQCLSPAGDLRTLPAHTPVPGRDPSDRDPRGGMDGFYAARLVRT